MLKIKLISLTNLSTVTLWVQFDIAGESRDLSTLELYLQGNVATSMDEESLWNPLLLLLLLLLLLFVDVDEEWPIKAIVERGGRGAVILLDGWSAAVINVLCA